MDKGQHGATKMNTLCCSCILTLLSVEEDETEHGREMECFHQLENYLNQQGRRNAFPAGQVAHPSTVVQHTRLSLLPASLLAQAGNVPAQTGGQDCVVRVQHPACHGRERDMLFQ
ncbi:hypothetical protein E2C01_065751 [Portunus trituberculatus]|uniref:Uncharacterized protein n=1 Tax=Portunus trituberculatus TaxID=210409 RepID=A0A5B7HMX6_PORTR|nr:hypothetical protein [Portunus trituberculatus]